MQGLRRPLELMEEVAGSSEETGAADFDRRREVQKWFHLRAKLALALAIVRTKPAGKSAKEYTEYLAKTISSQELNWKSKVKDLEAEVLRLRQQLLLSNMHSECVLENGGSAMQASLPQESIDTANHFSQLEADSGCDISNEDRMDLVDKSQSLEHSWLTFANTPSVDWQFNSLAITESGCTEIEKTLSAHTRFFQHLLGLRKVTESENSATVFTDLERDCSVVSDSVCGLLDGLMSFYKNPQPHFSTLQTEAIHILTRIISNTKLSNYVLKKCLKKCGDFEKDLIFHMLSNNSINRFQVQHSIAECLVMLGRCSLLRKPLLCLLLSEVNQFVDEMVQTQQNQDMYDITHYENMCTLYWILEQLFQHRTEERNTLYNELYEEEIRTFLQRLNKTMVHLSDEFPLFSLYTWRLGALFNSSYMQDEKK